ncbi:protein of unknown function [uncultured Sphingopyxis sp.]|uniref:Uncharacterized protein n=1 Tax=uncultured Sphingopyxis sp. TaxID=310581 RepID=A0A1Y5PP93_9SPHN|nr:protein of unknown function [uncultured Sphingopyxis sp.]
MRVGSLPVKLGRCRAAILRESPFQHVATLDNARIHG